ncbi:hypothetical protein COBT_001919 [Conglomerata obtusa]
MNTNIKLTFKLNKLDKEILNLVKNLNTAEYNTILSKLLTLYDTIPEQIASYIICISLKHKGKNLLEILKKCQNKTLQKAYPGIISYCFNFIRKETECDEHLLSVLLYLIEKVKLQKEEQKIIIAWAKKNYIKNLYNYLYTFWGENHCGKILVLNNNNINSEQLIFKMCEIVDKISFEKKVTKKIKTNESKYKLITINSDIKNKSELHQEIIEKNNDLYYKNFENNTFDYNIKDYKNLCENTNENNYVINNINFDTNTLDHDCIYYECLNHLTIERRTKIYHEDKDTICSDNIFNIPVENNYYLSDFDWPDNEVFENENEFFETLEKLIHTNQFVFKSEIFEYVRKRNQYLYNIIYNKYYRKIINNKIKKSFESNETIFYNDQFTINEFETFLKNHDLILNETNTKKIVLFYLTKPNFSKENLEIINFTKFNNFIKKNYDLFLEELIIFFEKPCNHEIALNVFVNIQKVYFSKDVVYIYKLLFDKLSINANVELFLIAIYKVINLQIVNRECLNLIFDELLYFDRNDREIRCLVYLILEKIFDEYYYMDQYIENHNKKSNKVETNEINIANQNEINSKKLNKIETNEINIENKNEIHNKKLNKIETNKINIENKNEACLYENLNNKYKDRITAYDCRRIDKKNVKVFAAKLWNDFIYKTNINEFYFYLKLLKKVIECSNNFYEKRMQKTNIFNDIIDFYANLDFKHKEYCFDVFFDFIEISIKNFELTKKCFEKIVILCLNYYQKDDKKCIFETLISNDYYFFYYIIASNKFDCNMEIFQLLKNQTLEE